MAKTLQQLLAEARAAVDAVSVDELGAELENDAPLLIDVRERPEFSAAHLPGAVNVSRSFLEVKADKDHPGREPALEDRSRRVVTYCTGGIGLRSILSAQTLKQMGFERAGFLDGGLERWREAGRPVES